MKIFISADIEGTAGITNWDEAEKPHPTYQEFRERMTDEVVAACEGAIEVGAKEFIGYIKSVVNPSIHLFPKRVWHLRQLLPGQYH